MSARISSRRAIITGGSSGIGRSIADRFQNAGFETAIVDKDSPIDFQGRFYSADLTDSEEIEAFVRDVAETTGPPDILICNAGRGVHEKLSEGNPESWEDIFRLNVFSSFRLIRAFVPDMISRSGGDVVFISSVSSGAAYIYGGIYTATKAAIDQLAETLRLEVQPDVRVTVIHPGVVKTDFFKNMINGSQTPEDIGWGFIEPDQVADAVWYAISQPKEIALNNIVLRPAAQQM